MVVTGDVDPDRPAPGQGLGPPGGPRTSCGRCPGSTSTRFSSADVVRHPLVQRIVEAYDRYKNPMSSPGA